MKLDSGEVRYEASDTFGEPGRYVHVPTGDLAVWVNAANHEDLHVPTGHFERHDAAVYVPIRQEEA